jgi:hypothetical protein
MSADPTAHAQFSTVWPSSSAKLWSTIPWSSTCSNERKSRRWTISAHAQADRVEVTDTALIPAMRDDDRQTYGLSLRAFFTDDAYVRASVAQISRSSTNAIFDLDQTVLTLQLGWEF